MTAKSYLTQDELSAQFFTLAELTVMCGKQDPTMWGMRTDAAGNISFGPGEPDLHMLLTIRQIEDVAIKEKKLPGAYVFHAMDPETLKPNCSLIECETPRQVYCPGVQIGRQGTRRMH